MQDAKAVADRARGKESTIIVSLNKKIKENNVLRAANGSKPITINDVRKESKQLTEHCSVDYYITSVLDQQQETYGYTSKVEKIKKNFSRELTVYDYLNQTSWPSAKKRADQIATASVKHREKQHQKLKGRLMTAATATTS